MVFIGEKEMFFGEIFRYVKFIYYEVRCIVEKVKELISYCGEYFWDGILLKVMLCRDNRFFDIYFLFCF